MICEWIFCEFIKSLIQFIITIIAAGIAFAVLICMMFWAATKVAEWKW